MNDWNGSMSSEQTAIARVESGQTLGPFGIAVPRVAVARARWERNTTRWQRFCWTRGWNRDHLRPLMLDVLRHAGYDL